MFHRSRRGLALSFCLLWLMMGLAPLGAAISSGKTVRVPMTPTSAISVSTAFMPASFIPTDFVPANFMMATTDAMIPEAAFSGVASSTPMTSDIHSSAHKDIRITHVSETSDAGSAQKTEESSEGILREAKESEERACITHVSGTSDAGSAQKTEESSEGICHIGKEAAQRACERHVSAADDAVCVAKPGTMSSEGILQEAKESEERACITHVSGTSDAGSAQKTEESSEGICHIGKEAAQRACERHVSAADDAVCVAKTEEDWGIRSILVGFGNDNITYGIARNNDDRLSYGARIVADAPKWWAELDFEGYTNRGWRTDWQEPSSFYDGRYDVIRLGYGMRFQPLAKILPSWMEIKLSPYAGVHLAGNLGLVAVQNAFHKIINRPYLTITYDEGTTPVHASMELSLDLSIAGRWKLPRTEKGSFSFAMEAKSRNIPTFETSQESGLSLNLLSDGLPVIRVWGGWRWTQSHIGWTTERLMAEESTGPLIGFDVRAGVLAIKYHVNPSTRVGYGIISVDAGLLFREPSWRRSEVFITMGAGYSMGRSLHIFKFNTNMMRIPGLSLVATVQYKGGPLDPRDEEGNPQNPRKRSNNSSWILSAEWQSPDGWWNGWVTPYASAGIGIRIWDLVEHTNHIKTGAASGPLTVIYDGARPLVDLEAGLRIIPPGLIKAGNTAYQIELSAGGTYVFGTEDIRREIAGADYVFISQIQPWMYRFSICLHYGIDL